MRIQIVLLLGNKETTRKNIHFHINLQSRRKLWQVLFQMVTSDINAQFITTEKNHTGSKVLGVVAFMPATSMTIDTK